MSHPSEHDIQRAADRLRGGGLVAFPTETVYGLGADALNPEAVARVFAVKGRPAGNPLIVHVDGVEMARGVVREWPERAGVLAERFWPGPLTLVLPRAGCVPDAVTAGGLTVAVRVPDHPATLALLGAFGGPIVGPSANPSGYVSPTEAGHVRAHFDEATVLVLDGGACRAGLESTVLDLTGAGGPRVLRRGVVDAESIGEAIGAAVEQPAVYDPEAEADGGAGPVASPGVLGPHYQPRAPVELVTDVAQLGVRLSRSGGSVALLSPPGRPVRVQPPHTAIGMPGLARGYARRLYSALREADAGEPSLILVVLPVLKDSPIWEAIRDRLRRAAA